MGLLFRIEKHVENWDKTLYSLVSEYLKEGTSDDYLTEKAMKKVANIQS